MSCPVWGKTIIVIDDMWHELFHLGKVQAVLHYRYTLFIPE